MNRRSILAAGAAVLVAVTAPADMAIAESAWPEAYSRRVYKLGITLSEFRRIRFPDLKVWPGAFLVCSDDPRVRSNYRMRDAELTGTWSKVGVLKCLFFHPTKYTGFSGAGLVLGDINSSTEYYFYPPKQGAEPVLFQITSLGPSARFSGVAALYKEAFGSPTKTRTETVQNRVGGVFSNRIIEYHNAVSSIQLSRYGETLRIFKVEYWLRPILERLNTAVGAVNRRKAGNL
jgi:hypothetical protein